MLRVIPGMWEHIGGGFGTWKGVLENPAQAISCVLEHGSWFQVQAGRSSWTSNTSATSWFAPTNDLF